MRQTVWAASVALGCGIWVSSAAMERITVDPAALVRDPAMALGGVDKVAAVKTLKIDGTGTAYNLGQDIGPDSAGQTFGGDHTRRIDLANRRAVTECTRTPNFLYFAGQASQRQVQGVDGAVAFNIAPNGTAARAGGIVATDRQAEFYNHPVTALQAALDPNPAGIYPFVKPLMANISKRGLQAERVYTIHAPAVTPYADLVKVASQSQIHTVLRY